MFALRASALSADFIVCTVHLYYPRQFNSIVMEISYVEELLTQRARLLARRDSTPAQPTIDWTIESVRQEALELFYQFQDNMCTFQDLMPICILLEDKVKANRHLLKWEQTFGISE
tara:strand:- start:609 stop:956 length:348 start_codon:yes stop_codon:yes gene_type:complete